jgi:purine-binding chemotaxis protein CheW
VTEELAPYLTFSIGAQHYGLPIEQLVEVAAMVELVKTPDVNDRFIGLANRRGEVLPMLDLRAVFGEAAATIDISTLFIVGRAAGQMVGLVVDAIYHVEYLAGRSMNTAGNAADFIAQVITHDERLIQVVALPAVVMATLPEALIVESEV